MKPAKLGHASVIMLLSACATAPSAINDYTDLGNHEVARTLRSALFLGEEPVNRSVGKLVNTPHILREDDPRPGLRSLGFDCDPPPAASCTYQGSAKSILRSPNRPGETRLKTSVAMDVMLESKPFKVVSRIKRENF